MRICSGGLTSGGAASRRPGHARPASLIRPGSIRGAAWRRNGNDTNVPWVRFLWSCRRGVSGGLRPVTFGLSGIRVGREGHDGWFAGGGVVRAVAGGVRAGEGVAGRAGGGRAGSRGGRGGTLCPGPGAAAAAVPGSPGRAGGRGAAVSAGERPGRGYPGAG